MVSALIFCFVAGVPVALDWNGLPLQKALESYGDAAGVALRCEPGLGQEPIFAWAPSAAPKEVMERVADVMVATWTKQPDGSLRLAREPKDRRRLQELRQNDVERRFGEQIKKVVEASHLEEEVSVQEAAQALKTMIGNRAKPMTEWERMQSNRALDARLAGGRLMARILKSVGPEALVPLVDQNRLVLSSEPTLRQGPIQDSVTIMRAFAAEHDVLTRASEQTGPPPLSSTGVRAQAWFSETLRKRPSRLLLRAERHFAERSVALYASVFAPDGEIAFATSLMLRDDGPSSPPTLPSGLTVPADPAGWAAKTEPLHRFSGGLPPMETRRAALALLKPDPLSVPFGERLRALAKANGRKLIARIDDACLRFQLATKPKEALGEVLRHSTLTDSEDWLTLRLRDPLDAETRRAPRPLLTALLESAASNEGLPYLKPYLNYMKACPDGITRTAAGAFWPYVSGDWGENAIGAATFHLAANCDSRDLEMLRRGDRVAATRLSLPARKALEHLVFRHPMVHFQVNQRTAKGLVAVTMGERCEPTSRVSGPLSDKMTLRLKTTPPYFTQGENLGTWRPLSPEQIASSQRVALGQAQGMRYDRFRWGTQYQIELEVAIEGDTTFGYQTHVTEIDNNAKPLTYAELPANLRRLVEDQLKD